MKPVQTEIAPIIKKPLYIEMHDEPYLSSPFHPISASFHSHPELQLTFIVEGYGKRIIGNTISKFEPGDMVFVGANVPHIWISDPAFYEENSVLRSRAITVYIDAKIFQQMFDALPEMHSIREMIKQASKGINIYGDTRDIIASKLTKLYAKEGFAKVDGLLQIMHLISVSSEKNAINTEDITERIHQPQDRLIRVIKYIKENIHEPITLVQVANVANMTIQSFSRFFKQRTNENFSKYLLDLRISHSCKLLIEMDRPISDIANLCGFVSHSHFCKVFKEKMGKSPYQYKFSLNKKVS